MSSVALLEPEARAEAAARRAGLSWRSRLARVVILLSVGALAGWWATLAWGAYAVMRWLAAA